MHASRHESLGGRESRDPDAAGQTIPRVVFDGYYGMRNAGDDAFCVVACHVAAGRWAVRTVSFVAAQSQLPITPVPARGIFPDPPRFRGHGRLAPVMRMLRSRRVVHVGGSTFMRPLTHHRDEMLLARANLLELHAVGVSVGPFRNSKDAARVARTLGTFRSITLRDTASLERLGELSPYIEAEVGFDVAVLLSEVPCVGSLRRRPVPGRPLLGVSLCAHGAASGTEGDMEAQRYERTAAAVLEVVRRTGAAVRLLVFNDHSLWGDLEISLRLEAHLREATQVDVVVRGRDTRWLYDAVADCDALIATRLHSAVFAYACEVPFALVAYQQKGADFAREVGLPEELLYPAHGPDPADAAESLVSLLEGAEELAPRLPLEVARRRARLSFPESL